MVIYTYMNKQYLAKCLLTSALQGIPFVASPFLFAIRILMVMEYGVLQHVRQSRIGSEGMLFDFAVSVLLQRGDNLTKLASRLVTTFTCNLFMS
jgi:hypothetical protein